jgi:tetratricopeptide (TPR) repeat protein
VLGSNQNVFICRGLPVRGVIGLVVAGVVLTSVGCRGFTGRSMNAEGVRLVQQSRHDEALERFREATFVDQDNPDGFYNLAATYHRKGRQENQPADIAQAEKYYNMCRERDPNHPECHRGLAVLLAEEGRKDEAFGLIEDWVARQPNQPDATIELARLTQEFGGREAAKEHLLNALAIDPRNPRALTALGSIRESMGEKTQALAVYQRSLKNDRLQPQVASRVAALQSAGPPSISVSVPDAPAVLVEKDSNTRR